jgi:ribosome-associated protein
VARLASAAILERKGEDLVVLRMDEVLPIVDYFVIATGRNVRHVDSMCELVEKRLKDARVPRLNRTGREAKTWVLLDYGTVVVHLFQPEFREYYDLELLWADAENVPLEDLGLSLPKVEDEDPGRLDTYQV